MNWTPHDVALSYAAYKRRQQAKAYKRRLTIDRIPKQHGRPPRIWTPGMVDDLRVMAARGMSYREIADALGIKRTQVASKMQAMHLKIAKKKAPQDGSPSEADK